MPSFNHQALFNVLMDTRPDDHTLPAFMVSTTRGFLPRTEPVSSLPGEFRCLESLLARMPIKTIDGTPGLLSSFALASHVNKELPDLSAAIEEYKEDLPLMNSLYRDYSFLASAYLLEPCHERHVKGEEYGLARDVLPACIARPMVKVAEIAGFMPFMEYAGSYALYNYRLHDPARGLEYGNLRLIRAFEHGLDPESSEAGFVLVHVAMVKHSGQLISGTLDVLEAAGVGERLRFNSGMCQVLAAMKKVNAVMNTMWSRSKPASYTNFRTFIFGITSQSMFPNGVIYEGVSSEPKSFRGESGANDSMIPLCDNLLQVNMPSTPLTAILQDFRSYRPGNHREFLEWVKHRAEQVGVHEFALQDTESARLYILALNEVRDFRWRHWCFTREYILKNTAHPTATGGSPIVTWLPNQLQAVLDQMIMAYEDGGRPKGLQDVMETAQKQQTTLKNEVAKYCVERGASP